MPRNCSKSIARRRKQLLDHVPNPPADDVPSDGEEDFEVLREVAQKPSFDFAARDHLDLAQAHGWIDAARGTKVSGSRFICRIGDLALLELALYRYALSRVAEKGHIPILPPVLVREEAMYGTGFFPTDAVNVYGVERDDLYLVGTSEVPVAAFHAQEILEELPLRYVAYSTCFRREAGAVRVLDIEAWFPGQGRYREITSTSNTTDFQSRRLEIRCRRAGKPEPVHTLNGTAITARAMIAILENFQQADGSIAVPSVLWEFGAPRKIGSRQNHL